MTELVGNEELRDGVEQYILWNLVKLKRSLKATTSVDTKNKVIEAKAAVMAAEIDKRYSATTQNKATYEAVMEAIGEDEQWDISGEDYGFKDQGKNELRTELRQKVADIYGVTEGKEE